MKKWAKLVGYTEACSFLILMFYAMPLKYLAGEPEMVTLFGSLHGGLFVAYVGLLVLGVGKHWTPKALIHGFVAASLPGGPFVFERIMSTGRYDPPKE
ncbi:MAG TPA: DUF3817 domain-containing protein [Candidatus Poseidoniales archaeon]|nr:MAG TPA: DUF3817 domain-containing protein [Candidatus Poseidoniales archaeon]